METGKGIAKPLHDVTESLRDSAHQMGAELSQRKNRLTTEGVDSVREYSDQASTWVQQNLGKTLGVVGLVAAVGAIGYALGKNNRTSEHTSLTHHS